jgi:poly-gamma-glutamate synthesis protein (capsule biosynthesis protein)
MAHLRVLLAGDVMTGRGIDQVMAQPSDPLLFEAYVRDARDYVRLAEQEHGPIAAPVAPDYIWGDALPMMRRAGIALRIVNLETAITRSDEPWPGKGIHYRMHPSNIGCLTAARIDGCALANNHVLDWCEAGLRETLDALQGAGVHAAGAGTTRQAAWRPAAFTLAHGQRVLVFSVGLSSSGITPDWSATADRAGVAFLPDLSRASLQEVEDAIRSQRQSGDIVILSIHWGGNWGLEVPGEHRAFAHALIDGETADLIHGHSSHHPLPIEVRHGRLILWGCGDLINDYEGIGGHGSLRCDVGCLYIASLDDAGTLRQLGIVPMQLRRFRLMRADAQARTWLERVFRDAGGSAAGRLEAQPDGSWHLRW